jgi:hypothetical protein
VDETGNRYEMRRLGNGERYEIVKNVFDRERLTRSLGARATAVAYRDLRYLWVLEYIVV